MVRGISATHREHRVIRLTDCAGRKTAGQAQGVRSLAVRRAGSLRCGAARGGQQRLFNPEQLLKKLVTLPSEGAIAGMLRTGQRLQHVSHARF